MSQTDWIWKDVSSSGQIKYVFVNSSSSDKVVLGQVEYALANTSFSHKVVFSSGTF